MISTVVNACTGKTVIKFWKRKNKTKELFAVVNFSFEDKNNLICMAFLRTLSVNLVVK